MADPLPFTERKTVWRGVLDLATGCYPGFLFGGGLGRWLPVFHFHEVTPEKLTPYLEHLASNGYRTVTSEAIADYVRDGRHPGPRSVGLCFDDAWASVWTVAAPLLRRYGFQAITYVHPGRVVDAPGVRPTIDSAEGAPVEADRSDTPFATWPELKALHASGTMDIQAHSLWHAVIDCSAAIAGFVTPDMPLRHPHLYPRIATGEGDRFLSRSDWGAPLHLTRSRYSDALRYDAPAAFEACTRHVREHGGAAFFRGADWDAVLRRVAQTAGEGRQESPPERDAAILADLAGAREQLNARLGSDHVRHMCFPFVVAGSAALRAAEKAGYVTAFSDRLWGRRFVQAGDPPYQLMRLKHAYITCLPGTGRRTVFNLHRRPEGAGLRANAAATATPRLCLLTGSFHPVVGGGETHARLLCAELRRRGVSVFVLTRRRIKTTPAREIVDGFPVYRVAPSGVPRFGKYLMMLPAFLRLVRLRRDYDLIYVCGLRILGLVGALAALALGKRCVLRSESRGELSGAFIWETIDGRQKPLLRALFRPVIALRNAILRKADAFLSISGVIREEYEACGIPPGKLASIVNGIDEVRFSPVDARERGRLGRELGLPAGLRFAYSGKLNRGKGLEFLLRVWEPWSKAHPEARLVLIGSGAMQFLSCEPALRDFVATRGLGDSVVFTGNVGNVHDYLKAADAFLFPSESEALPLALLEAMATGLPVVASDIGGIRDVIRSGREGRLVPPNDMAGWTAALDELAGQPERASAYGAAGRATVLERFSMTRVADAHEQLFRAVCQGRGAGR